MDRPEHDADAPREEKVGRPGEFPYTRGLHAGMYRDRLWTMRQYAGFGSAAETNARFHFLLAQGQTGLSVAFDLPTQLGLDPDDPRARGEVGRVGVSIATLSDMRALLRDLPLGRVSTSMTINAPAMMLLALYELVAEENGTPPEELSGTVQNDILKEFIARGAYIFPPGPSMRLVTDLFEHTARELPRWNPISISGYHIREAGASAAQELGFTFSNARAYLRGARAAGLDLNELAPRLSFFFAAHSNLFEEVAKFRAARRLWAHITRDEFGVTSARGQQMRMHVQTGGSTLTAAQPHNNVARTAYQALAAVLGGAQSLHTNAFDEALSLPTAESAQLALRTQQVLAFETGVTGEPDPLGGAPFIEALTDDLEREAREIMRRVEDLGGAERAIERGFIQSEIEESAYRQQQAVESGEQVIVGVNRFSSLHGEAPSVPRTEIDPRLEPERVAELRGWRVVRDAVVVWPALDVVRRVARGPDSLYAPVKAALKVGATLGEVCNVLREEWGEHRGGGA